MSLWFWLGLTLLFLVVELFTGAFVLVFFAFSALVVALVQLGVELDAKMGFAIFSVVGILSLLALRKKLLTQFKKGSDHFEARDEGQVIDLPIGLEPGAEAQVAYQGTVFTAINADSVRLEPASRVRIVGVSGVKLRVVRAAETARN